MKRFLIQLSIAALSLSVLAPQAAYAKRFGGGNNVGMQRSMPPAKAPDTGSSFKPSPAAAPAAAGAGAAAAAAKPNRSWMGPLAGIAAGLGLAALMSHLGMGGLGGMGEMLMMVLMAAAAFMLVKMVLRRFAAQKSPQGLQFAGGAGTEQNPVSTAPGASTQNTGAWGAGTPGSLWSSSAAQTTTSPATGPSLSIPADFDTEGFERIAKLMFIRLQAANDTGDLTDLRAFTTNEMFATAKLDLQDRGDQTQQTDVVKLNAELLDVAQDATQQIVSVRFHGLIREEASMPTTTFDEIWHVVKPLDGHREWAIAGIAQRP
jgi:predicted lipid-binding transport protein (Tim44 family)